MDKPQQVTILGATGTIGLQTLDVISRHPDRYALFALTGHSQVEALAKLCVLHQPKYAVVPTENAASTLREILREAPASRHIDTEVLHGSKAMEDVASAAEVNIVMAAIVGAAGLQPTLAAARAGKRILLANKETLVMAGSLFMQAVSQGGATLLPIDSEHNALFQVLPGHSPGINANLHEKGVRSILLTASGGPFRTFATEAMTHISVEQALTHPNWVMGRKITIDSATLMNKGLEVVEAHWLFGISPENIRVVVHPQSVIHSMVEYIDGSVLAQMGNPDMRIPIAYGLAWPERIASGAAMLDLFQVAQLQFEPPDLNRFPCLGLAYDALYTGGCASAVLNAANEVAVKAFLTERISFVQIPSLIADVMSRLGVAEVNRIEDVLAIDTIARAYADEWVSGLD